MNYKKIKIIIPLLLMLNFPTVLFAVSEGFTIHEETFLFEKKEKSIFSSFDRRYDITTNTQKKEEEELKQKITELTKKTTYLLLGEANKTQESSENYYKRHKEYLKLRYNPEVPKDENSFLGLDENSQEYKDDLLSGISVPGMFLQLNELGIQYSSYGEIRVSILNNEELIISTITLKDITMKEQDEKDPRKYNMIQTDLTMYYYFKELNGEYKLFYLYGETKDEIEEYMEKSEEKVGTLSQNAEYLSNLEELYDFSKVNAITDRCNRSNL